MTSVLALQSRPEIGDGPTQKFVPLHLAWLELTQNCNLRCRHCYVSSSPARAHSPIDWFSVLDQLSQMSCKGVQFIGGEPTRHPDFCALVEHAYRLDFEFMEVFTNLTDVTTEQLDLYRRCGVTLATSFYSVDPATHDLVTLTPGSFEATLRGIDAVVASGLKLRVGIIDQTGDDAEVARATAFLVGRGVPRHAIGSDRIRGVGRGGIGRGGVDLDNELCGRCGINRFAIAHNGDCYPCVMARHRKWGNVREQVLSDIIEGYVTNPWLPEQRPVTATCEPLVPPDPPPPPAPAPPSTCKPDIGYCHPDHREDD